jgi:PhnB protein
MLQKVWPSRRGSALPIQARALEMAARFTQGVFSVMANLAPPPPKRTWRSHFMKLEPYLFFNGKCEEALSFYQGIFGGEIVSISRFKDMPPDEKGNSQSPPGYGDKIMHATFKSPSFTFMASDGPGKQFGEGPISLCLELPDAVSARRVFDGLAKGGKVEMPMNETFWSSAFGMLTDAFGIAWMVTASHEAS